MMEVVEAANEVQAWPPYLRPAMPLTHACCTAASLAGEWMVVIVEDLNSLPRPGDVKEAAAKSPEACRSKSHGSASKGTKYSVL